MCFITFIDSSIKRYVLENFDNESELQKTPPPTALFGPKSQLLQALSAPCYAQVVDKAPRPSINNVIWILSSDTICQLNQLFSNSEAAMLSLLQTRFPIV